MVELVVRLALAAIIGGVAFAAPLGEARDPLVAVAALAGAYSVPLFLLERRGLRNSGVAGLFAGLDAIAIGLLLSRLGVADSLGALVLAPIVYATARFGALASAMAPIAAGSLLLGHVVFGPSGDPPLMVYAQVGLVLVVGLLMNQRRILMTESVSLGEVAPLPAEGDLIIDPENYFQLRESYRTLRDEYLNLQRRSRRDRLTVRLIEARRESGPAFYRLLATLLADLTGADEVLLHTYSPFTDAYSVRAFAGEPPQVLVRTPLRIQAQEDVASMMGVAADRLRALLDDADRANLANVALLSRGRPVGMITLAGRSSAQVEKARAIAQDAADLVTWMIAEEASARRRERRLREAELLYELATSTAGATTPHALATRIVHDLSDSYMLDHIAVFALDGMELVPLAEHGRTCRFVESMSFAYGPGLAGYLKIGAPELAILDVGEDQRCPREEALRERIGTYLLFPIQYDETPYGFLSVAHATTGEIDMVDLHTFRLVAAELGQALGRLAEAQNVESGLMSAGEFQAYLGAVSAGWLIYLEPLRRNELTEVFGRPALQRALREFARQTRARLPRLGAMCRRAEGDFVAFLPDVSEAFARSWANETAAMASMVAVQGGDRARQPLAVRARTAPYGVPVSETAAA